MLNNVSLMGRLTDTPELRKTTSGLSVTSFTVAVGRSFTSKSGERQTDFIDVVAWRQTAEFVCKYFKKGQMIALKGSIQVRTYQDKEGNNRKATEILAENVYFTESRGGGQSDTAYAPASHEAAAPAAPSYTEASFAAGSDSDFSVIESDADLPF